MLPERSILVAVTAFVLTVVCGAVGVASDETPGEGTASPADRVILTPKPPPEPRIHGPSVFGVRPGRPFLYRVPCTGKRPLRFSAEKLPESLQIDPQTGIVTGRAPEQPGEHVLTFRATNDQGVATRDLKLVVGDQLALTPPMGWNSWYIHYNRVTESHMRAAARQMVDSGMADAGYMYVNIDDCWMKKKADRPYRDPQGAVLTNDKFPDIKGMVESIHAQGLRAGTYISPGPWTCAGYVGSYQHEQVDAKKFAEWGFDFLKYDWCSYSQVYRERMKKSGDDLAEKQHPYQQMSQILRSLDRDIVLNLCQYGMSDVWTWGGKVGGHCWRTTGDLGLERGTQLPGFFQIGFKNMAHWQHARPGAWNDPDYLLIGWVGNAHGMGEGKPTPLSGNEQYAYMSMWCLMAAPLIFSGDMAKLDDFTLNVLCNTEVIAVDQDVIGKQAKPLRHSAEELILAKPMEDGSLAVGLFNLTEAPREVSVTWSELGIAGKHRIRDLWRQRDLDAAENAYAAPVGRHGVQLVRLWPIE